MAYNEKYYKQITRDEHVVRLSIYQRSWSGTAKEIGDFKSLHLELQGSQADIESPIVKSSCVFSMVDSADKPDTSTVKYGNWEEFYTPDQTLYLVRIAVDSTTIWSGYITPDSWEDDLIYRGVITITARDMLGHLNDFEVQKSDFDDIATDNMASVINIIGKAWNLAMIPMGLTYSTSGSTHWLSFDGQKMPSWALDVTALIGRSWYDAVESILDSLGLTLRYTGRDIITLCSIRDTPLCGYTSPSSVATKTPQFIKLSGHRSLTPAYKKITELLNYEAADDKMTQFTDNDFSTRVASGVTYWALTKENWEMLASTSSGWTVQTPLADGTIANTMMPYVRSTNYYNDEVADKSRYVFLNMRAYPTLAYRYTVLVAPRTSINIQFSLAHCYTLNQSGIVTNAQDNLISGFFRYRIEWLKTDGSSLWLNSNTKRWDSNSAGPWYNYNHETDKSEANISIEVATPDVPGRLRFWFFDENNNMTDYTKYVRMGEFAIAVNQDSLPQTLKVNTNYDAAQNTTLKRNPDFGQLPAWVLSAGAIKNGLYKMAYSSLYPPIQNVKWNGTGASLPVAVFIHLQHIAMHAKANNILTGDIKDATSDNPNFNSLWQIYNRTFLLVGGSYNLLTGTIEGATLVEFDSYDDVVGDLDVDYTYNNTQDVYKSSNTESNVTIQGGGGGGGGGVSSVAMQVPTGFSVEGSPITSAGTLVVSFATGYSLPTTAAQQQWTEAFEAKHSHNNLATLNGITATKVNHWDSAYSSIQGITQELNELAQQVAAVTGNLRSMPKLRTRRLTVEAGSIHVDQLIVEHPAIGLPGYEAVLMVYAKKNGRKCRDEWMSYRGKGKKGWSEARGYDQFGSFTSTSGRITFQSLRQYLLNFFIRIQGYSREVVMDMELSTFQNMQTLTPKGFDGNYSSPIVTSRHYKRFGIAIRAVNPAFSARLTPGHSLSHRTMEIGGEPRYLYSAVAPLDVYLQGEFKTEIWFGMTGAR